MVFRNVRWPWTSRPLLYVSVDRGTGPVVVLVHGIASSAATFANLIPLLVPSHRVVAIDLLGFGDSPAPSDATYTMAEHVDYLERTIKHLGLSRFVLVGHSLGSLIAARYGAQHQRRVQGLVLVSPPIYLPPESFGDPLERTAMGLYLRAYEFLRSNKPFTMRNAAFLARLSPIKDVLEVSERNWKAFALSLENVIELQTAVSDLASVSTSIHLVYGTLDPFLMPGGLRIVEQMRHVTAHRVVGADHLIRPRVARVTATAVASVAANRPGNV